MCAVTLAIVVNIEFIYYIFIPPVESGQLTAIKETISHPPNTNTQFIKTDGKKEKGNGRQKY